MIGLSLYYSPGACSLAVHVALEEARLSFEARRIAIAEGMHRSPEYLVVDPRGRVPAMWVDGTVMTEVQALLQVVADLSAAPLVPSEPVERARMRELLAFQSGTVHVGFAQVWRPERFTSDRLAHATIVAGGRERLDGWFDDIDAAATHGWMVGGQLSLADLLPFVFHRWARRIGADVARWRHWERHTRMLLDRPAVARALKTEELDASEWLGVAV